MMAALNKATNHARGPMVSGEISMAEDDAPLECHSGQHRRFVRHRSGARHYRGGILAMQETGPI